MVTVSSVVYAFGQLFVGKWYSFAVHRHAFDWARLLCTVFSEVMRWSIWFILKSVFECFSKIQLFGSKIIKYCFSCKSFYKFRMRARIACFLFTYPYLNIPNLRKTRNPNHSLPWICQSIHLWNYILTRFEACQSSCYLSSTTEHRELHQNSTTTSQPCNARKCNEPGCCHHTIRTESLPCLVDLTWVKSLEPRIVLDDTIARKMENK